ncbi:hypothetical protein KAX97_12060, partial [candidate division WOR-3 bacterium]|nr:hypothetical protein [candidate division WOR-3 bacterium]
MYRKVFIGFLLILLTVSYGRGIRGIIHESDKGGRLVPKMLNYQGYLTDTEGIPIDAILDMRFRIYDVKTGGTPLWDEDTTGVSVERGIFNALLGSVDSIPASVFTTGTDRWLELILNVSDTLKPRTRITAMAYAYMATHADTAEYAKNAISDNDWIRGTGEPLDTVLFTANYLGLARGGAGNVLYGDNVHTHTNLGGYACTTGVSGEHFSYLTIAGGCENRADSNYSAVVGGYGNRAQGEYSFIGGGEENSATGLGAVISGGYGNTTTAEYATIGGGQENSITPVAGGSNATIAGGAFNIVKGYAATVSGGGANTATGYASTVCGGEEDSAIGSYSVVAGGQTNIARGEASFVAGGKNNTANGYYSFIGGGLDNYIGGDYSVILGGYADTITDAAHHSFLFGFESTLTKDSTFMIDMPHIRFGDETNGYEFPTTAGLDDQVMAISGTGQLSWTDVDDSDWVISGNNMYSAVSGSIGIGVTNPAQKLDIAGTAQMTGFKLTTGATDDYVLTTNASGVGSWQLTQNDSDWT